MPGRLIVAVANASNAGITVGNALADQEDRQHAHSTQTSFVIPEKQVAAIADDNQQAAMHGTYTWSGTLAPRASGYPFTQLPLCRFRGGGNDTNSTTRPSVGFGTVAPFSPEVSACPTNWSPMHDAAGRVLVPGYAEGGPIPSPAPPLASGEDRVHSHSYAVGFHTQDVSFEGVEGCCNSQPAKQGAVTLDGTGGPASTGLPYVQLLTCVNSDPTFDANLPPGALLFNELACPPGWSLVTTVNGRLLVSLPTDGVAGASFGGDSLPSLHPVNPAHHHTVAGNVTLPPASVLLASGCCGSGYAATGTYAFSGPSADASGDLPYTLMPMCQQDPASPSTFPSTKRSHREPSRRRHGRS